MFCKQFPILLIEFKTPPLYCLIFLPCSQNVDLVSDADGEADCGWQLFLCEVSFAERNQLHNQRQKLNSHLSSCASQ